MADAEDVGSPFDKLPDEVLLLVFDKVIHQRRRSGKELQKPKEQFENYIILRTLQPVCRRWFELSFQCPSLRILVGQAVRFMGDLRKQPTETLTNRLVGQPQLLQGAGLAVMLRLLTYRGPHCILRRKEPRDFSTYDDSDGTGTSLDAHFAEACKGSLRMHWQTTGTEDPLPDDFRPREYSVYFRRENGKFFAKVLFDTKEMLYRAAQEATSKYNPKLYRKVLQVKDGQQAAMWLKCGDAPVGTAATAVSDAARAPGPAAAVTQKGAFGYNRIEEQRCENDRATWGMERNTVLKVHYAVLNTCELHLLQLLRGDGPLNRRFALHLSRFVGELFNQKLFVPLPMHNMLKILLCKGDDLALSCLTVILLQIGNNIRRDKYEESRKKSERRLGHRYTDNIKNERKVDNWKYYVQMITKQIDDSPEKYNERLSHVYKCVERSLLVSRRLTRRIIHWAILDLSGSTQGEDLESIFKSFFVPHIQQTIDDPRSKTFVLWGLPEIPQQRILLAKYNCSKNMKITLPVTEEVLREQLKSCEKEHLATAVIFLVLPDEKSPDDISFKIAKTVLHDLGFAYAPFTRETVMQKFKNTEDGKRDGGIGKCFRNVTKALCDKIVHTPLHMRQRLFDELAEGCKVRDLALRMDAPDGAAAAVGDLED